MAAKKQTKSPFVLVPLSPEFADHTVMYLEGLLKYANLHPDGRVFYETLRDTVKVAVAEYKK